MPKQQLHKRFSTEQVKAILAKYEAGHMSAKETVSYLEISRSRFYQLVDSYEEDTANFSINYQRIKPTRVINPVIEENILKELNIEKKKVVDNPDVPIAWYNYSYVKQQLARKYQQTVSVPTIISRAKNNNYWRPRSPQEIHDQEVVTSCIGELVQHDSSHHLFAPDARDKWYLITSCDDYSRLLLYADLWAKETTWYHILALQSVFLTFGLPAAYYADQHRIFRYVKNRDKNSPWATYTKFTDDVDTQWKQVMRSCGVKVIYALSPQAKGKVERPYGWLQDHLVRTCARKGVTSITEARKILKYEVDQYNYKRIHSTIKEVPVIRFKKALKEHKSLFREFKLTTPFQSIKDIFCLRITRTVDAYRHVSLSNVTLKVPGVMPKQKVELRLYPDLKTGVTEVRFWSDNSFKGSQEVKSKDMSIVQF